jgi:hypothetical protein
VERVSYITGLAKGVTTEVLASLQSDYLGRKREMPSLEGRDEVVLLLHGIGKSSLDMAPMTAALRHEGYCAINWKYPSRSHCMDDLAGLLAEKVAELGERRLHFVTHSMGGIIVRKYLTKHAPANVGRFVMIGTPNQGAYLADKLSQLKIFDKMFGPAGRELCQGERGACANAGVPVCEFGIIAGGLGWKWGWNPLVPGDNDGTVSVECTRLEGARDFVVVPHAHPVIQMMPRTIRFTLRFLESGTFSDSAAPAAV